MSLNLIEDKWISFQGDLENICTELSRDLPSIVVVSKNRGDDEIQRAIDIGINTFGENYPQELKRRAQLFPNVSWHFIGHLQSRKTKLVAPHASIIHSLDRKKLADRLSNTNYEGECFVQINITSESSKHGIAYSEVKIRDLISYCREKRIRVTGIMAIGSLSWNHKETQEKYDKFVILAKKLKLAHISLGMSDDWKFAIRAGSTYLRVGSLIFGPRK